MSVIAKILDRDSIFHEMISHSAWYGDISGLNAEKKLRGRKTPYLYLLRQGEKAWKENEENYYVTFLGSDFSVRHQPFVITSVLEGYFFENGSPPGAPLDHSMPISSFLYLIMHCEEGQCVPLKR